MPGPLALLLRVLKWLGISLGVLVLALALVLYFFDWNRLRGPISNLVSERLGRHFAITGELRLDWSWTPRLTIAGVELDNVPWSTHSVASGGGRPEMFSLDRAQVSLRIPELFKGHLVVPEIEIDRPRLLLEKNAEGRGNWEFSPPEKQPDDHPGLPFGRRWFPRIERLAIRDGRVGFDDPASGTRLDLNLNTAVGASNAPALELKGEGRLQERRFTLSARGGSILTLWETGKPFPIDLRVDYGDTGARVRGSIAEPLKLEGPDLRFEAQGPDLAALRPFTRAWIPETPPYRFAGRIRRDGERWRLRDFEGRLGGSDLSGDLAFLLKDQRPTLDGDVVSKRLDFRDFAGFIGASPKPDAPPRPKLLPDQPYDVAGLRVADANIRFHSGNLVTPYVPVDEVAAHVVLERGMLTVKPARASIGVGQITAEVELDARGDRILTRLRAHIAKVPFRRFLEKTRFAPETGGQFFGKVDLTMAGNSVAAMAATADGGITVIMERGRIGELFLELIGMDIAEALGWVITKKDRSIPIQCLVDDFLVSDGVMKTRLFLIDTTDTKVTGSGQIDLRDETLDFRVAAHPKDPSLFSARTPVLIKGTFKKPEPRPELTPLLARAAASVGLGLLAGPAALLPWVELGLGQDSPCRALLEAAQKEGAKAPLKPGGGG